MVRNQHPVIRFTGPPAKLSAELNLPRHGQTQALVFVGKNPLIVRITGDAEKITRLEFSMPADTPPGEIATRVVLGESEYEAVIDVQQRSMIRVEPSTLKLKAAAGDTVAATLNVTNLGNLTLKYEVDQSVILRPSGALAHCITSAFKNSRRDFVERLISVGEELASTSCHEFAVASEMKASSLETGESTTVELKLNVPKDLKPETTWSGSLALLGTRVHINVETITSRRRRQRSATRGNL